MSVLPLSVHDHLYSLRDRQGAWTGVLQPEDLQQMDVSQAVPLMGPAGSVTVHNARCVHGGPPNTSSQNRPLLLNTFAAATAQALNAGTNPLHQRSRIGMPMVRGREWDLAVMDPRPCPMAPNFSNGYTPPFFSNEQKPLLDG